ncbi:hypothetical protein Y032_0030g2054 [Ancylostoma ceylanicum]|uniref:Reverse transcriptase domain-containing protein n=1 Tax=Ancylostoma ceylanicum TaxID=53326 RepID=A0A016UQH4_9BILA|nr:hypothetical protein Y032_0030g2054 [Ancylostoma ceylanicum]
MQEADIKFRILASGVLEILNKYKRRRYCNMTREQWEGFRQLREMRDDGSIRVTVSDKGEQFVPQALDSEITDLHLSDATIYRQTDEKKFMAQCRRLNDVWVLMAKSAGIDERFVSRLKIDHHKCPIFYSLVKTHKLSSDDMRSMLPGTYKIRPIVSCVGGPTDRILWFSTKVVGQLLPKIPAHLTNTKQFLERLRASGLDSNSVMESFDVASLYTNVENSRALQAVSEMLQVHTASIEMYGLSIRRTITLIKDCLNCNIFKWSGKYFSQIRGLAMGQRLAPVLAICFMSKIEQPVLARLPLLYCRYIHDSFIVTSTQSEIDECFNILNGQSENIQFTREVPEDGWLAYLNTHKSLSSSTIRIKWYRKAASENILLHATFAHPASVKRAVVRNIFRTARYICTGETER